MKASSIPVIGMALLSLSLPACELEKKESSHVEHSKIILTSPLMEDVTVTQQYVCQMHSCRHIEVCALEGGYLEEIPVREGQSIKQGELMFKIVPILYQAKLDTEIAEADLVAIELQNTKRLFEQNIVAQPEVAMAQAKNAKAQAKVNLVRAELNFANVKAPFDGIIDRLRNQKGSLIKEGDILTTLSDNSTMWVYFNVPEARYLEYKQGLNEQSANIELVLANGKKFGQTGKIGAIEADFNNETGNIAFRADFPNPDGLLRHGQTGNILINRVLKDSLVIPQRATFEVLDKTYVYVVGEDNVVHQRLITIEHEKDDIFVIKSASTVNGKTSGLTAKDKIVLEGGRQVREGEVLEGFEFVNPEEALKHQKNHAE